MASERDKLDLKVKYFEYFVYTLILQFSKDNPGKKFEENDFSKLKIMLLLFLSVSAQVDKEKHELLDIFDNFYAMPYGTMEKDILDEIDRRRGVFSWFELTTRRLVLTDNPPAEFGSQIVKSF